MGNPIPLKFDFLHDGRLIRSEKLLLEDHLKVGKLSSSHLRIDDPAVSRMHAVIERRESEQVELLDLGSTRGTMVNGERIDRRLLRSGDRLQFGATLLVVQIGDQDILLAEQLGAAAYAGGGSAGEESLVTPAPPSVGRPLPPPMPGLAVPAALRGPGGVPLPAPPGLGGPPPAAPVDRSKIEDHSHQAVEVTFLWGDSVLRVDHFKAQRDITIGGDLRCDYAVDPQHLGVGSFPLVKVVGTALALTFNSQMKGMVQTAEGETLTLDELRQSGRALPCGDGPGALRFLLPDGCSCRVGYDEMIFLIHLVPAPRHRPYPFAFGFNLRLGVALGISLLFWALVQTLFFMAVPEEDGFLLDSYDAANRFAQLMVIPEKKKEPEVPDWFKKKAEEEAKKRAEGSKAKAAKMGQQDSDQTNKKTAVKGPQDNEDLQLKREQIRQKVVQTGALAALANDNELAVIWSASDKAVGADAVSAVGNWTGDSTGNSRGFGGLAMSGTGRGGGSLGEGSLGVGGLGTRGRATGNADYGRGVGDLGDRSGRIPKVIPGKAVVTGSLDREIIRRIIGKHREEIKYCYEKELTANKDLSGKVVVFFTIAPTGQVVAASVRESTLKNPAAESCIITRVQKWSFPQPNGGGIVEVTYPFIFKAI